MSKLSLESIMMNLAHSLAQRSLDPKKKVGCVVTDEKMERVLGMGYNAGAKGQSDERESMDSGCSNLIHAEVNALIKTDYSIPNKKVFLTLSPCRVCAKMLVNAGISEVYYNELYNESALEILTTAGIRVKSQ